MQLNKLTVLVNLSGRPHRVWLPALHNTLLYFSLGLISKNNMFYVIILPQIVPIQLCKTHGSYSAIQLCYNWAWYPKLSTDNRYGGQTKNSQESFFKT